MPQELQPLYQAASKKFNLGTYENFEKSMRDPKLRKTFYDAASKKFNLGDFNNFNSKIDSLTSIPGEKPGEDARITSTPSSPKEEKVTGDPVGKYSWGRATSIIDGRSGERKEPEWRAGSRPLTDYATLDKEPVTSDAIWKSGLNVIGAKDPDQYDFINRRMELGSNQLNQFTKFKVEKEGLAVNAQKISGLLDKAQSEAEKQSKFYEDTFSQLEKQIEVAKAANDIDWQNKLITAANGLIEQQKADPAFKTYNDLVTKYNELSKYEKELPAKYPMVKEQQAEAQKVQDEYKDGGFWTKAYFQTAYPAMGAFNEISKSIMGASDHLANLTGLMSSDELRDYTEYKKGTIAMPAPDQTELFNPSSGKFQAAGILPTMFKVGLQSYGFYKGGAIINQTGIPMGASQWLSVFTQTYPMFYEQGIESGLSSRDAQTYAALSSGTEAIIERILPEEKIFGQMLPNVTKVYKGVKVLKGDMPTKIAEFTKGYLRVAIPEVTEEVLADVAQNIYQNTANDMVQSSFDVKPLTMQEEAKTIVTTAIGMAPMSLMGGYNRIKNITKVARYEAGLAPKSYIEFAEKEFGKKAITQKAYDDIVKTANSMAEIIALIPDVTASGREMTKEKKIELANLLYEQKLLAEKKAASPPLFKAAFDEAAADLEERMNKAYGVKVEEDEQPVDEAEPVVATDEQTEELDEETVAEIEGLKEDIGVNTTAFRETKIETVGNKEFYSHEGNEYEVKRGKTGELEFENSTSGQPINRKSPNYDKVVAGYVAEKYADAPATEVTAQSEEEFYSEISTKSTNPLEILLTAAQADDAEGGTSQASAKDLHLSQLHISFNAEDLRTHFGYDISDMGNWEAVRSNYYSPDGPGIDQSLVDINLSEDTERFTVEDLWDFIERYPKGLDESTAMGPRTKALGDRFSEITGAPFDRQMLEAFKDVRAKAARIPEIDQAAMFDWMDANPTGTIEELKAEVELTEETKTVLDETEKFKYPWETEESQEAAAGSSKTGDDVVKDEAQRQEEKGFIDTLEYDELPKEAQEAADRYRDSLSGIDVDDSLPTLEELGYRIHEDMDSEAGEGTVYFEKIDPVKRKEVPSVKKTEASIPDDIFIDEIDVVTPKGFTNRLFESNMQLGKAPDNAHISEEGYNYRTLSQKEIDAIIETGGVFSREGKQKGGNTNTKYWTKGNNKNWYGDKENIQTIRVSQDNFKENEVVRAEDVEVYNRESGKFEPLTRNRLSNTNKASIPKDNDPLVSKNDGGNSVGGKTKERNKIIQNHLLDNDGDIDGAFGKAGYVNVNGIWVAPEAVEYAKKVSPKVWQQLKDKGIKYLEGGDDGRGLQKTISYDNKNIRGIGVNENVGDGHSGHDHTMLHETAHHVWQEELTPEQRAVFSDDNPVSDYAKSVKEGKEKTLGKHDEEDFAELYAKNDGDVDAAIAEKKAQSLKDQPTNKKQLPDDFRDLSPEDQGGVFVSSLNKGDTFTLRDKKYSVKSKSEKQTVIVAPNDKNITVKHGFGVNYGNNTANQFFRDIEGELTVDLINENNPLHEFSDVYNKTKQRYSEILNENNEQNLVTKFSARELGDHSSIAVMENLIVNLPQFADMFREGIAITKQLLELNKKAGYNLFSHRNSIMPFPYAIYSKWINSKVSTQESKDAVIAAFKENIIKAKEYLQDAPTDAQLANLKTEHERKLKEKNDALTANIDKARERQFTVQGVVDKEGEFIRSLFPEKPSEISVNGIASRMLDGVTREQLLLARKVYDAMALHGGTEGKNLNADFAKVLDLTAKRNFNIDLIIDKIKSIGYTTDRFDRIVNALKAITTAAPVKPLSESQQVITAIKNAAIKTGTEGSSAQSLLEDLLPETIAGAIKTTQEYIANVKKGGDPMHISEFLDAVLNNLQGKPPAAPVKTELQNNQVPVTTFFKSADEIPVGTAITHPQWGEGVKTPAASNQNIGIGMFIGSFGGKKISVKLSDLSIDKSLGEKLSTPVKTELDAELDNFVDLFKKIKKKRSNPGIINDPEQNAEDDLELISAGAKLVKVAMKTGLHKFADIVSYAAKRIGDTINELLPYMQKAYTSLLGDTSISEADLDKMDDPKIVRNFKLPVTNETEPTISGDTTAPDNGSGNIPELSPVQQSSLFDGPVQQPKTKKGTAGSSQPGADNKRPTGKGRQEQSGSAGNNQPGDTVPEGPQASDERTDDPNLGTNNEENPKPPRSVIEPEARNFVITPETVIVPAGEIGKIKANIAAIKLLKLIESENRQATPSEKEVLGQFVGWGGVSTVLSTAKSNETGPTPWKTKYLKYYQDIKSILTTDEWNAAVSSTTNAHYTDRGVIEQLWSIAQSLGFVGGKVLESSAGIGHIMGLMPSALQPSVNASMVELDSISGRIMKMLYPENSTQVTGFEEAKLNPASYDLAITNVPFGQHAPFDKVHTDIAKFSLHNYFMAKNMRMVKPGGIGIFISTWRSMDHSASAEWRRYMDTHEDVDFIGAIKLPNTAQDTNAGTQITTDIIILQKRVQPGKKNPVAQPWLNDVVLRTAIGQKGDDVEINVNQYYIEHPEMMLGDYDLAYIAGSGGLYGADEQTLVARRGIPLTEQIAAAAKNLPKDITSYQPSTEDNTQFSEEGDQEGTYVTNDKGEVFFVDNGERVAVPFANDKVRLKGKDVAVSTVIKMFVDLKMQVKSLVSAERNADATDSDIEERRAKLRRLYSSFVDRYGVFNRNSNIKFLMDDSESMLVYALETLKSKFVADKAGRIRTKVEVYPFDILYKRVNHPYVIPDKAENITDAVNISLVFHGNIDLDYISSLLGGIKREDAARLTLENGLGYEDPQTGEIIEKDIYLSGNVREKLKAAEAAKQSNPRFEANYEALKGVQPTDIPMRLIAPALGAGWIPVEIYERFFAEILGRETKINYNPKMARNQWGFSGVSTRRNEYRTVDTAAATWGILGYDGATLAGYAMNLTDVVVRDPDPVNKGKYIKNAKKTEDVNNKIDDIRAEFVRFLKETDDLHEVVEKQFNETQNSYVEYKNSRSIKRFPGQSEFIDGKEFGLREHQAKAVLRSLRQSTLLAHGVGSGKTYTIITAAMEMKRLKLANKPMIVAWNETLEQFTESARKLYPAAKILSPTANQMDAKNRQRLIASMVYGDWDMIIIPHSFMKFIPNDPEREIAYLRQRIAELEETKDGAEVYVIADIDKEIEAINEAIFKKSTKKVKDVAKSLQGVTKRVKKQLSARRDQTFLFEESGIDALFIDEADAFKKIGFTTSQRAVRGIDVTGSQKALDAYMKTQWVRENNAGRNVILATGTPVTNTIAELWTMMRYVAPETLTDLGIETFDQFATSFANIDKTVEMTAGNTFKEISRLKTYKNAPALISAFRNNADVVLSSEVKEFQEDNTLPKVKGGEAEKVIIDMSKPLERVMEGIKQTYEWWENLKGKEKKANKHVPLVLYGLAKKAAVDLRLLNTPTKRYEDDPNSKLNQTVNIAYDIYKKNDDIKGMQLIFCDSIKAKDGSFNAHQEMKKKLMALGVPESEIVIADDKFKGNRRMKAMQDANDGIVRFMIGHTDRLGVGLNVQTRCVALIHVDAPPRPRDYEQRNGRIIRQGNLCAVPVNMGGFEREVRVINMGVKNTLDRLAYERLQFKQFFINQILSGKVEWGEMEDPTEEINPSDLQHGAMGALLGGSQTGIKVNELRRQLRKIESAYDNFNLKLRNLTTRRNQLRTLVPYWRDVRKAALDAFIKDIPNYTNAEGQVNRVVINGKEFSSEVKPLTVDEATTILNDTYQGWEKYPLFPGVIMEQTGPNANWTTSISNAIAAYGGPAETVKLIDALKARLNSKLGTAIENAVAEGRNKASTEGRDYNRPIKTVIKIGSSFVATVSSYETRILDKEDAKRYNTAMGAKIVTSDLSIYETLNDKAFNYQYANSSSIIQRIYPEITAAQKEVNEIDPNIEKGEQELKDIDIELKKPFIGMDDMTKIRGKINELQLELIAESTAKPDKEVVLTEDAQAILDGVKKDIDDALTNEDETEPTEEDDDPDDDFTPSDNEVNEPPSDALYNAQKKIEDKLDNIEKGLDNFLDNNFLTRDRTGGINPEQSDILGGLPKPIFKAALKIIRYSVKAGFSIARAFRNGYRYIQTTDWYRERVANKNPYDLADLQQMLTDYGVTQATDLDSLDKYLKRIRKFVNGATPAELESALNNLTNFITQRVKSIGLSDTRLFLDAIDKIRKSQGSPTRLATAIVNFEKAVDQFIYREQYREAIRAKREARRNLVKGQKFPDIRLLGMELVNLPIVKNREKIPIELLWRYLEAINPLAVKGKELIPNVRQITNVIREVTDWANSIADREEADRGARDTTGADAKKEQQMDQWRQDIDQMKASFDPASILRAPEIDGDLQQMIREFVALDHNTLEYAALKNYWGIMINLSENKLVSPNIYNDWVLPRRKQVKADSVRTMARDVQFYFDNIRELVNKLKNVPKTLWDSKLLRPDPALRYDAPFWNHFIQPLVKAIEKFRIDYQTVAGVLEKLYQKLGKHSLDRAKAAMEVRMWAFANQVDHNRSDIDFKKKLLQSLTNMKDDPLYSDIYKDYLDAYNSLKFAAPVDDGPSLIDLKATFDAFTPAQKAFAQGLASLITERLQPIVQYQQMYVRGENVNFIEGYHPMAVLGGVNVEEATTESQVEALLSNNGLRGTMLSTKAGSMFARTYPNKVFYSFSYPSLLDSIEGTLFDKHLTEPVKEVFGAMVSGDFTTAFTSSLASEMRKQMMSMLKHEIGFNEQAKSLEQRLIDSLIRSLTGRALVSIKRFAEAIPNWSVAAPHISDNPYDAVKTIYNSSRNFFDHPREWLEMMRDNGFSVYMRFSTHSEMIDTPGGKSVIIHNPFLNPLKHLRESKVVRKIYDQQNKTKFEQLASDAMAAFANNNVSRMGVLIQQMSIGIGDYVSSFPIWVASFNQHLTKHGHPEWVPGGDNSAIPQEAITAAGNFAENVVDRSVGTSNRGRSAEKTYSFATEDERKRWYAYALGRFNWFLGVLMFQQTAYFRHHAANLIKGGGEYGRLRSAGVLAGLIAGNVAFNLTTKIIGAIIIGLGGDDEAKKKQLADLGTKEYWARNLGSALLQLSLLGKMPYFSKIIMSMGVEALNKYITEEVMDQSYNSYHDALVYSPRLPLPTEWAQSKQVYNAFMPFMSPVQSIYEPIIAGTDMVANGNPTDDALVKFNMMKAALAITNLAITIPFVNKEVYGVLNAAGMPVKASDYDNLRDIKKERTDLKDAAKKEFDSNYAAMDPEIAKERLDSLILEAPNTVESERLQSVKKMLTQPKYDQMTAFDKFLHSYPAAAKAERIKQDLNTMPSEQIKEKLEYYRNLGVISQNIYQELMDEMYLSQHLDQMTPQQRREHRYRMEQRKSK